MKTIKQIITVSFLSLFTSIATAGGDVDAGKEIATKVCASCHGIDGDAKIPTYPRLGGQYASYLAYSLKGYKSGERKNPIMAGFAAMLSDEDIANVSAYFSKQPSVLRKLDR